MSKKARDLLPPDDPTPPKAEEVRPSDDDLECEVETRKIGIRRVTALDFADRLTARNRWRPAGNSRRFWRQIEADDPFKKRPARPTDAPLDVYPAQRIHRVEGSMPKPQPEVAKAYPGGPRPDQVAVPARPAREPSRPAPEPVHTPDPRSAPAPPSVVSEPEPPPEPAPPPEPVPAPTAPAEGRRLPPKPANTKKSRSGRQRMPSRSKGQQVYGQGGKTAAEIRAEKAAARKAITEEDPHPLKQKTLDSYRETMQNLIFSQDAYDRGDDAPEVEAPKEEKKAPRKMKGEVKRRKTGAAAQPTAPVAPPKPAAPQPAPSVDPKPPKPKAPPKAEVPLDRSPSGGRSGGLNDLLGGGGDRVRIGRRGKPTPPTEPEDEG